MQRILCGVIALIPLACWPGLEHPFATPKLCLLAVAGIAVLFRWLAAPKAIRFRAGASDWLWLAWLAAVALSALLATYVSADALLLLLLPLPLAFAIERDLVPRESICNALIAGSTLLCIIAIVQFAGVDPLRALGWVPETFANPRMRVHATLGNPNFVAAWCVGMLPLAAVRASTRAGWAAVVLHLAAIVATGSRVALLALPAAAVVLILRRHKLNWRWLVAVGAILAASLWMSPARPVGTTIEGRLYLARVAASGWRQIPLTGHGPGNFELQFARQQTVWAAAHPAQSAAFAGAVDHAHNDYLEMLVELGPVGLGAFLAVLGGIAWRARRIQDDAFATGAWGGAAALAVTALVDFPLYRPAEWTLLWLFLGVLGRSKMAQNEVSSKHGGEC